MKPVAELHVLALVDAIQQGEAALGALARRRRASGAQVEQQQVNVIPGQSFFHGFDTRLHGELDAEPRVGQNGRYLRDDGRRPPESSEAVRDGCTSRRKVQNSLRHFS